MNESQDTTRRAALVTGSSRGIGLAVAEQLAAAGFNVALNCSSEAGLSALREQAGRIAGEHGVQVVAIAASVADEAEANALVEQAHEAFGRLDAVVNNAGITRDGLMVRMKDDDFDRVIDVNLKGTFHICRAAGKIMMKQRYGRIVNMSSIVRRRRQRRPGELRGIEGGRHRSDEDASPASLQPAASRPTPSPPASSPPT